MKGAQNLSPALFVRLPYRFMQRNGSPRSQAFGGSYALHEQGIIGRKHKVRRVLDKLRCSRHIQLILQMNFGCRSVRLITNIHLIYQWVIFPDRQQPPNRWSSSTRTFRRLFATVNRSLRDPTPFRSIFFCRLATITGELLTATPIVRVSR